MRKKRKKSPRPLKWRGHKGLSATRGETMRKLWEDPEYRARMEAKRQAQGELHYWNREGVPDGMRREQAEPLNLKAEQSAKETMAKLEKAGVLVDDTSAAKEALEVSIKIMRQPGDKKVKLAAAKQVLEWTKAKPASKQDITVNAAEAWLEQVAASDDKPSGEAPSDA